MSLLAGKNSDNNFKFRHLANYRDGINGCIQGMFVPALSGILIFGDQTCEVFTFGYPDNPNYDIREVPEMEMLAPYEPAKTFSSQVQQALRNIKSDCYKRSLEFSEAPISKEPPTYDEVMTSKAV